MGVQILILNPVTRLSCHCSFTGKVSCSATNILSNSDTEALTLKLCTIHRVEMLSSRCNLQTKTGCYLIKENVKVTTNFTTKEL